MVLQVYALPVFGFYLRAWAGSVRSRVLFLRRTIVKIRLRRLLLLVILRGVSHFEGHEGGEFFGAIGDEVVCPS